MNHKTFETERLYLRPTSVEDAPFILELMNTPKWMQFIGDRKVTTVALAEEYIQNKMLPQLERLGYSNYTLITKQGNQKVGTCGLYDREGLKGVDIGFALLPGQEKKGYAFEAAEALKNAAFDEFKIDTILVITTHDNTASQRLLEKLGLEFQGTTRIPNDDEELLLYKIES